MTTTVIKLTVKLDITVESDGRPDRDQLIEQLSEELNDEIANIQFAGGDVDNANPERDPVEYTVETVECMAVTARGRR